MLYIIIFWDLLAIYVRLGDEKDKILLNQLEFCHWLEVGNHMVIKYQAKTVLLNIEKIRLKISHSNWVVEIKMQNKQKKPLDNMFTMLSTSSPVKQRLFTTIEGCFPVKPFFEVNWTLLFKIVCESGGSFLHHVMKPLGLFLPQIFHIYSWECQENVTPLFIWPIFFME